MPDRDPMLERIAELGAQLQPVADFWDKTSDLIVVATAARFVKCNPAWSRTLGWSEEELTSRDWMDFVHPDDRPATSDTLAHQQAGEFVRQFENRYIDKQGKYHRLSWRARPVDPKGYIYASARIIDGDGHGAKPAEPTTGTDRASLR